MTSVLRGACFCGAVVIEAAGQPIEMGYCHCASCRAYSGAPFVAFTLWRDADVRVVAGEAHIGHFNRSGLSDRVHCRLCGGALMTLHPGAGVTDVYAPVLAGLDFRPAVHLNYSERVVPLRDGLPKLRDFPAGFGGSGEVVEE